MNTQQKNCKAMIWRPWYRPVSIFIALLLAARFALSFVWPLYEWNLVVPSPDNRHVLIVLRGDVAAFADFSYRIYIFPTTDAPARKPAGMQQLFTWPWRGDKYLAYDGSAYPMFRWTSKNSVEIDFNEASPGQAPVDSIFSVGTQQDATVISFKSGVENDANALP